MASLTDQQEAFCQAYVANGGHATNAALEAGYAHPRVTGSRLLTNPKVSARVKELTGLGITTRLGELVHGLFDIAMDQEVRPRDRITALIGLMDRGGLTPYRDPATVVAVQVNIGDELAGQRGASGVIRDIEALRGARLGIIS